MSAIIKFTLLLGAALFFPLFSVADSKLKIVPYVDLKRYMGDWNVIANIPNFIERNCVSSIESYSLREDGNIDNWFLCKKSDGNETKLSSLAWVYDTKTQAEWRVRFNLDTFFGKIPVPLHFTYWVIDLDSKNYTYTVVGHPSRNLLWIMARGRTMEDRLYKEILYRAKDQGYDISKVVRLDQSR
jgi:apolipoprotein D and lipocalin family protein